MLFYGSATFPSVIIPSWHANPLIVDFQSDFNTGEFTTVVKKSATVVDFQRFSVSVGGLHDFMLAETADCLNADWRCQISSSDEIRESLPAVVISHDVLTAPDSSKPEQKYLREEVDKSREADYMESLSESGQLCGGQ
jgi:hypothetical protein